MRVSHFLLTIVVLHACLQARAQRVSISGKNLSLQKVFTAIQKQTGYNIVYDDNQLIHAANLNLHFVNTTIAEVLDTCLHKTNLTYSIVSNTIIITATPGAAPPPEAPHHPEATIRGIVVDSNSIPLTGATILVRKTKRAAQSGPNGAFVLIGAGSPPVELEISHIGFQTRQYQTIPGEKEITIVMTPAAGQLDLVAVVAYGVTTQRYDVGSVVMVPAKAIERQPVDNPLQALTGQVAGLQVTSPSGAPGSTVLAQIRGQNSLSAKTYAGSYFNLADYNQPLFIIDGIPFAPQNDDLSGGMDNLSRGPAGAQYRNPYGGLSPLSLVHPGDIESITILKDADATAIYGARGSNGVVILTTKKGKPGDQRLNVNVSTGPTTNARVVQMMNTRQYLQMRREALANDNKTPSITPGLGLDYDLLLFDTTRNINWYDELLGKTAQRTDAHINFSGGTSNLTYLLGAGYTHTGFNFPGNFADRRYTLNGQFGTRGSDGRLNLGFGQLLTYDDNTNSTGVTSFGLINTPPDFPSFLDGSGRLLWSIYDLPINFLNAGNGANLYAGLHQPFRQQTWLLHETINGSYTILDGLSVGATLGYSRTHTSRYSAVPMASLDPAGQQLGSAKFGTTIRDALDIEPQLKYTRAFGRLTLNATLGCSYQKSTSSDELIDADGYRNDALLNSPDDASFIFVNGGKETIKYAGGFGRVNLIWDKRYIFNLTGNLDGSSLFGPDHRYGRFGSVGGGWIFSETQWIKTILPWLSFAKLTASYGVTGTNSLPPYQYQPNWIFQGSYTTYQGSQTYLPVNPYIPDFHWASKKDYNGHLTFGLFKDWLLIDAGVYLSRTSNQLLEANLPAQTGFIYTIDNAPYTLQNKGWELSVSPGRRSDGPRAKFVWTAPRFNISRNYNKLVGIPANSIYAGFYFSGNPASAVAFVKCLGVDPATGLFQYLKADGTVSTRANGAPVSLGGDANQLIDLAPSVQFGFGDGFSWRGLSVSFDGSFIKQKGYNHLYTVYGALTTAFPGRPSFNQPAALLGKQWQKPGDKAAIARFSTNLSDFTFPYSTGIISTISYLRLTNLNIDYELPGRFLRKWHVQHCHLYIHIQNLLTLTSYPVGDPESQNIYTIPPQRIISCGTNLDL